MRSDFYYNIYFFVVYVYTRERTKLPPPAIFELDFFFLLYGKQIFENIYEGTCWSCVDIHFHTIVKFRYLRVVTISLAVLKYYSTILWIFGKKTITEFN